MNSGSIASELSQEANPASKSAAISQPAKTVKINMTLEERKALRAKRFGDSASKGGPGKGVTDEILKKRAERFGVTTGSTKDGASGANDEVLKKRAQRFGVISDKVKKIDHQEKLRKRQQRFVSS